MSENTDNDQQDSSDYLLEPFVTEDGIEVPPPTRPMGPRRLARYRDDAAAYLRALRDGLPLPEEPVAYMPAVEDDSSESEAEGASAQSRFSALAAQGDIDTSASAQVDLFANGGRDTREDVSVADGIASSQEAEEDSTASSATDISFGEIVVEEDSADEFETEVGSETETDSEMETEPESEPEPEPESEVAPELPQPVAALDAQGLDFTELDQNEQEAPVSEDAQDQINTELDDQAAEVTEPASEGLETRETSSESQLEAEETSKETTAVAAEPTEETKKSGVGLWVTLLLLLLIAAAVIFWFVFMQ